VSKPIAKEEVQKAIAQRCALLRRALPGGTFGAREGGSCGGAERISTAVGMVVALPRENGKMRSNTLA